MSHDFLTSLHSAVIDASREKPLIKAAIAELASSDPGQKKSKGKAVLHRTVGVSMSPHLQERAASRAEALGLPFSRYVQWCVEAELDGVSVSDRFKT